MKTMTTIYLTHEGNEEKALANLMQLAERQGYTIDKKVIDKESNRIHWAKRELCKIIDSSNPGDILITDDAAHLARSTLQILEIFEAAAQKQLSLYFIKYQYLFKPLPDTETVSFLKIIQHIETEFVAKRTSDALARRRAAGLPLGRPKGRKNKSRKLDAYRQDIKRYMALHISKASIARLVGCHAQTLYNYIDDTNLFQEVDKERDTLLKEANNHNATSAVSMN